MAVTKQQMEQWSRSFEQKYPEKAAQQPQTQTRRQVSQQQMEQWEQGYQTMQTRRTQESAQAAVQKSMGAAVLGQMMGSTRSTNQPLQLAVPNSRKTDVRGGTAQPEWLGSADGSAAARIAGTVQTAQAAQAKRQPYAQTGGAMELRSGTGAVDSAPDADALKQTIAAGGEKRVDRYAQAAQYWKNEFEKNSEPDRFDELNRWMDEDTRHRELVDLIRGGAAEKQQPYAQRSTGMQMQTAGGAMASAPAKQSTGKRDYTDAELLEKGYTQTEINEAKAYIRDFDALPAAARAGRRAANTIGGIAEGIAAGGLQMGESIVRAVKNSSETKKNRDALKESLSGDARQEKLFELVDTVDSNGSPKYSDADLMAKGYTQDEVNAMRSRYAGTEVKEAVDPEKSVGYQLHKRSQDLTAAAQAGLSPMAQKALGVVSSAGENLVVASIDPWMVLPALSVQGAGESMGQSIEKGDSAGKTLAGGALKFGAGWAINSVGAADLAKTMGADYAKDTLAGKLADAVRSVADNGALAQKYPVIANAISGGMDNAMQAFVETYADKAIDAALGDAQAAESLFRKDTFLDAVESGLTGGASGALGGAVGTGLKKMNAALEAGAVEADRQKLAKQIEKAVQDEVRAQEPGMQQEAAAQQADPVREETAPPVQGTDPLTVPVRQWAAQERSSPEGGSFAQRSETADAVSGAEEKALSRRETVRSMDAAVQQLAQAADAVPENVQALEQEAGQQTGPEPFAETEQAQRETADAGLEQREELPADPVRQLAAQEGSAPEGGSLAQKIETADAQMQRGETRAVENAGESVENAALRETYGLEKAGRSAQQREVQRSLEKWSVSQQAAQSIGRNMPEGMADAQRYAAAASSLYRLGQMQDVGSFEKAMELARGMKNLAVNTEYVMASSGGEQALHLAWLQGRGEMEAAAQAKKGLGGALTEQSTSGTGRVLYKGTVRSANEVGTKLIELNAKGTATDAVLKAVLQGNERVRAYVDTETGRIFFADGVQDVFGTILHEDWHWYAALDAEGAAAVQQHMLEYLAKMDGYENVDEMIRGKLADYAQQKLTYEQAAEELVADAWRGVFSDEAGFRRWVEFQREQAEKNAGKAGTIRKVMNKVRQMLDDIVCRAKEVLEKDPENRAAMRAQRLAEAEKRALQEEYFAHAEKAMDKLRAAKENAAALKSEGAAKGVRFRLHEGKDSLTEQMNNHLSELEEMDTVADIRGTEVLFGKDRAENITNIVDYFNKLGNKVEREGFGIVELTKNGARATVEHGNSRAKQIAVASIPEVIQKGIKIGFEKNWQNRGYDTHVFAAPVKINGAKLYEGVIVREYILQNGMKNFYVHEVCWTDGSYVMLDSNGNVTKKEDTPTLLPKAVLCNLADAQEVSSETSIAQDAAESKENNAAVKKTVRFALSAPVEVDGQKELVAVHNLTEQNLREALQLGGMPSPSIAVVKAREGHTKYGPVSLVFGSDTIDPMVDRANRVYGADAWTPTRPGVEYEVNYDAMRDFENRVYEASGEVFDGKFVNSAAVQRAGVDEASSLSREELAQKMQQDTGVQLAYLKDKGITVEPVYRMEQEQFDSIGNDALEAVIRRTGEAALKEAFEGGDVDRLDKLADAAADALEEKYTHGALEGQNKRWMLRINKLRNENRGRLYQMLEHAYKMVTDTSAGKQTLDVEATRNAIREKAPEQKVEQWVYDKLEGVLGEKGIRNEKEPFTPSGKKRSFAQLHNPYTLENLVKAMNSQNARGQDVWGVSASTLMSTTTAEYKNLDEVRADKDRLQQMPEAEYKKLLEDADSQIEQVIRMLRKETTPHSDNSFEEQEILGEILLRAAQGKHTAAAIGKAFAKEGYIISKDAVQSILALYKDVAKIPTGYFEAKPQRAVGFDEVRAAILPDDASETLVQQLKDAGVPVMQYKAGDEAARTEALNKVPDVRFQLAEKADRETERNEQLQASRAIANKAAALDTLSEFFGLARGVKVSRSAVQEMAARWAKSSASKVDREQLTRKAEVLVDYLKAEGADMEKASALAETLAGEVLDGATYRNTELWDEHPGLHRLEYTVNKTGQAKAELVKAYGSWSEAVAEARKHGVTLRQAEGVRDGNPAEQYESVVNDVRAVGAVRDGESALWKAAAEKAGVDGAMSMESTEWLQVLMNLHDAIKPRVMRRFADDAEYEDARVELAGRMLGDVMKLPELNDAQAIFEGIQQHNLTMARMGAQTKERAAEVEKGLLTVQKEQRKEFDRRMREKQEAMARDAKGMAMLDDALELSGADVHGVGDVKEKLQVLAESYDRELKKQVREMKAERQAMLDEAKLEVKQLRSEKNELAWQLRQEQRRADKAEWSLIVQENEIAQWEEENERKREAWQQEQAKRNALAIEAAQQQMDEDVAVAKRLAEKRVQKARDARDADRLKRSIRQNATQLNQMVLRPAKDKFVPQGLVTAAAQVAKLADAAFLNDRAVNQLTRLEDQIRQNAGNKENPNAMTDEWEQSGMETLIRTLREDLQNAKNAKLERLEGQLAQAESLPDSEKKQALMERLQKRIRETENRTYLPLTVEQLRMLKAITSGTLHVIRNANKTVSLAQAEQVSEIAAAAAREVRQSKGNHPGGKLDGVHDAVTKYQLDMLGAERVFRMLGGYTPGGQMEKIAQMLNDGQYRQTKIMVEGEKLFEKVTGKEHAKQMEAFAGPGADLVDVGLKDDSGKRVMLTHAQLCSLYMHLHNEDSMRHLMTGGMTVPDAELYHKGKIERAYQEGQTVRLGMMTDEKGMPMAESILQTVEGAMSDYDRAWCEVMRGFFDEYTTKLINETSLQLLGYKRAVVKNYYPIAVDKATLATQIEGVKMDATIEGRGFLKNRVKSGNPILLEECSSVVQRSLRDTAAYAGLAAPIRDAQKILNCKVEGENGVENLKNGILKRKWGQSAVSYIDDLLTDLQHKQRKRPSTANKVMERVRGNYAAAVLTLNPGVAIAQAASLPTAAAVLGGDTMAAVVPFVKNLSPKQRAALEAEITQHGDVLLAWRKRGAGSGELQSMGRNQTLAQKAMDRMPKALTGWINGMDEITVAALWEGSKAYVKNHAEEFEGAGETGSPAYWEAVNRTYQRVIERTQPNYTTMQRAGIQRNPNELLKQLTMFTTQRFQNYGILADAVGDYKAQVQRYKGEKSEANRAQVQRAGKQLQRAAVSQGVQTAVFALMKIGADFLLHRWDREQDENGDITAKSVWKRFGDLFAESFAGNFLYGSEVYSLIDNVRSGKDYDVLSAASLSVVNDLAGDMEKFRAELKKDTEDMDEDELEKHHEKLMRRGMTLMEDGFEVAGVPFGNGRKIVEAVQGYWKDLEAAARGEKFRFSSVPKSATGQYDRLYNAYAGGDAVEAQAAMEKLAEMGKEGEMYTQLKNRMVKYDPVVKQAAEAQNAGDAKTREKLAREMMAELYELMGIDRKAKADAEKREAVIDCVNGAVNRRADEVLKGDNKAVTDDLAEALDSWDSREAQREYDRLVKAGKAESSLKTKITELMKPEYLAGSEADRERIREMLKKLKNSSGEALYTEKNFAAWEKNAAKTKEDPYADLR